MRKMFVKKGFILFFTILCLSIRVFNGLFVEVGDYTKRWPNATRKGVNEWECGLSYVPEIVDLDYSERHCYGNAYPNRIHKVVHQRYPNRHHLSLRYGGLKANKALREEAPWTVIITTKNNYICTGVLITLEWVLTHAECPELKYENNKSVSVSAGIHKNWTIHMTAEQVNKSRFINEFYLVGNSGNADYRENGVSLLKLPSPFKRETVDGLFYDINTICLPSQTDSNKGYEMGLFAGWGKGNSNKFPTQLKIMSVFLNPHKSCPKVSGVEIKNTQLLCSTHKKGATFPCDSDWGGPLFQYSDKQGSRGILIGIFDYVTRRDCSSNFEATDVWVPILTGNIDFILNTIRDND